MDGRVLKIKETFSKSSHLYLESGLIQEYNVSGLNQDSHFSLGDQISKR